MCISRFIRILAKYFEVPEPVRDVSFILDKRERAVLEEAIGTVNSMKGGWDSLRNPHFSPDSLLAAQIKNSLKHPSHTEDTLSATMYLLKHMAHNKMGEFSYVYSNHESVYSDFVFGESVGEHRRMECGR